MFYLMNKDTKLAELEITNTSVRISRVLDTIPPFIDNLDEWVNDRSSILGRNNLQTIFKLSQYKSRAEYISITRAISLTDTFWIMDSDRRTTWSKVSPYQNRLSKIISDVALDAEYHGGKLRSPSPDYNVAGTADKCWKRQNGKLYLLKSDGERYTKTNGNRAYCEYYASQVAKALGISNYVNYTIRIKTLDNGINKPYAICEAFTSEDVGYVPIDCTKFRYHTLPELFKELSVRDKETLVEMLLLDAITMNIDRHSGNYGFLYDTNTFRLIGLAPIYDNDFSLGPKISLQGKTKEEAYESMVKSQFPKTELGSFVDQGVAVMNRNLYQRMVGMYPFKFRRIGGYKDLEPERLDFMEFIVNEQIRRIATAYKNKQMNN